MSRRVAASRLDTYHLKLSLMFRPVAGQKWLEYRHENGRWEPLIEVHDLICMLDELRMRRRSRDRAAGQFKVGPITRALMAMKVGDVIELQPMTQGALTTCRQTARVRLEQPDAVWWSRKLESGLIRVERKANGSPLHRDYRNPAVEVMAAMEVDDSVVIRTLKGKMHNAIKVQAKKLMNNPQADWRCENLNSGDVRVRRTK